MKTTKRIQYIMRNSLFIILLSFSLTNLYAFGDNDFSGPRTGIGLYSSSNNNIDRSDSKPFFGSNPRLSEDQSDIGGGIGIFSRSAGDRPGVGDGIGVAPVKDNLLIFAFLGIAYGLWIKLRRKINRK
jgi:hypothetical protein